MPFDTTDFNNGMNEFEISVYPNPANDAVKIAMDWSKIEKVTISNFSGVVVKTIAADQVFEKEIDISDLPAGLYLIKVKLQNGSVVAEMLVKQ